MANPSALEVWLVWLYEAKASSAKYIQCRIEWVGRWRGLVIIVANEFASDMLRNTPIAGGYD